MSAYAMKHFDLLNFLKKSKELGASEALAEYQGRQIEEAIEVAIEASHHFVESKELTSKKDSTEMENRLLLKMKEIELQIKGLEAKMETKLKLRDLELKILQNKNQTIIWIVSVLFANGLITHLLK